MNRDILKAGLALAIMTSASPGFAQEDAPSGLASSDRMTQDGDGESWTFIKAGFDLSTVKGLIIEPTVVYSGEGSSSRFKGVSSEDREKYARVLTEKLQSELAEVVDTGATPGAGTARLRLTLLGMTETTIGLATASRASALGLASSALNSVTGREGKFTGSMLIAIELFDARSGELLVAAARRRAPDALDIPATISTSATVDAIARDLAADVRRRFEAGTVTRPR